MSQNVNVNLTPGGYPKEFHVSQYDVGRQLVAKVVDSTGDYSIPSGATAVLVGTKPSGFGFTLNGTVSGSTVTFSTTATVTAEYGRIPCELRITSGDTVLGTANLMLIVEESPHQEGVIDGNSETVIPELTILVERVEAAASNVLDMQVEADTLPAGSSATYSYDEETNTATFGIPQGEAGAGAAGVVAPAYSASSTYAVGDYVIHGGNLYRCTTAITTAEAFTAAHWTQVVLGDDVSNLKSDLTFGAENICPTKSTTETSHGITYTPVGDGSYKVNGTSTAHVHYDLYQNTSGFLDGFQAGDSFLTYYDNPSNSAVKFWVAFIVGGADQWQNFQSGYNTLTIPSNATGMKLRLTILNGNTVNNVIVKPYIFNSKTKHEYDEEIGANTENVDKILNAMPYEYNPMSVQTINGLIGIYGETVTPDGYAYARIPVAEGEKYKVSGWYYAVGGNFPAYMLMNGNTRVSFYAPSAQGAFYGEEVTIPSGVTDLYVNGYPGGGAPVVVGKYGLAKVGARSYDSVLVGTTSDYDYTNINTAILNNNGSIISVDYGTYETEIENLATNKKVIGKDADLCVLTGTDKDYDHPPIEIAGGIIKNFTVNMVNSSSAAHKGYCLHSDNAACADNTLTVENCKFSCSGQHSVGMGIYPGEEVIFKDCFFENLNDEATVPIYMHNSGASDGVAVVRFHNCYFTGQKYAMQLQGWGSNANIKFEFIDCTCTSVTYGTADDCVWTDYVSGSTHDTSRMHEFSGKFTLLPTSHGNNISVLNA